MSQNLRNPSANLNASPVNQRVGMFGAFGRNQSVVKKTTQTVNNSAVLVNDAELSIYLATAPKTCYYFILTAQLAIAAAANNLRYAFTGPDGLVLASTSRWFGQFLITAVAPQVDSNQTSLASAITGGTTNAWTQLIVQGVICPEQAGTLQFQFAQNVAGATNTQVLAGSSLVAWELPA